MPIKQSLKFTTTTKRKSCQTSGNQAVFAKIATNKIKSGI
jgi:hypothetical protein